MTVRQLNPTALQVWRVVWCVAAFGGGVYAGYKIAFYYPDTSGWGVVGLLIIVPFWVAYTGASIAVPAIVSALLYRKWFNGGLPGARIVLIALLLYAAGLGVGYVMTPALGLEYRYREPVVLEARGTMTLRLDGMAGYVSQSDVTAHCWSVAGGEDLSWASATTVGTIDGGDVSASMSSVELEAPIVSVSVPTANFKMLSWSGPGVFVERTEDRRDARVAFVDIVVIDGGKGGPEQGDWPESLSGTLTWSCGEWIGPVVTPGPGATP